MIYIVIRNRQNKSISVNLMGHFRAFIQKYTNIKYLYFTMMHDKYDIIYSSYVKMIEILNDDDDESIIDKFEKKYKDFTMELSDSYMF